MPEKNAPGKGVAGRSRLKNIMVSNSYKRSLLPWVTALLAAILAAMLFAVLPCTRASAAVGGINVGLEKLVFSPADTINLTAELDSAGQALSGNLELRVYPAASPSSADPFAPAPIAQRQLAEGVNVNGTASVAAAVSVSELGLGTGGYPARVVLAGAGGELLVGDVWLAVVEPSAAPIDFVLLWTVGGPPQRNAQFQFTGNSLVDRCRNEPRTPDSLLQHELIAREFPSVKTTYAIEPLLLDELRDITDGYELVGEEGTTSLDASSLEAVQVTSCIESLKQLPTFDNVDLVATPYSFADLTLLARQGWSDGTGQYRLGHDILTETLLLAEVPDGAYVPQLNLTTDSLAYIAATGGEFSVLAGSIRPSVQTRFPDAVSHRLRDLSGERLTGFFANDDISGALLGSTPDADAFFAGLVNAYAAGDQLAIAAAAVPNPGIGADMRRQVYLELARQPWVNTITLTEAKDKYRPDSEPATLLRYVDSASGYITRAYYARMEEVHEQFEDYRAAVDAEEPQMVRLTKLMYMSESSYLFSSRLDPESANSGLTILDEIEQMINSELAGLEIKIDTPLLQRSSGGSADITITNNNPYAFTVELNLVADKEVSFPEGATQELRVESGTTRVDIPYESGNWSGLEAQLLSRGNVIISDDAGIRPLNARFWLASFIIAVLLAGGVLYYVFVIKRGYGG